MDFLSVGWIEIELDFLFNRCRCMVNMRYASASRQSKRLESKIVFIKWCAAAAIPSPTKSSFRLELILLLLLLRRLLRRHLYIPRTRISAKLSFETLKTPLLSDLFLFFFCFFLQSTMMEDNWLIDWERLVRGVVMNESWCNSIILSSRSGLVFQSFSDKLTSHIINAKEIVHRPGK